MTEERTPHTGATPRPHPGPEAGARVCDGQLLKRLVRFGLAWLEQHQAVINSLNVYPVPDGDTGTNMVLTMQAAYHEVSNTPEEEVGTVAQKVAHGALMGARGNSGVILSQIFRGLARSLTGAVSFNTVQFAAALREAAATAYKGVIKPVEGTILTVVREAAEAGVVAAASSEDLRYVLEQVVHEARQSVMRTPSLLPVLAEAGVVDAGGQGLLVILEGMLRYAKGDPVSLDSRMAGTVDLHAPTPPSEEGYGYDIQFIIHGEDLDVDAVRAVIASLGESALVVGDSRAIKVHVHSPDPGAPVSYGAKVGSLSKIIVENMQEQYQEFIVSQAKRPSTQPEPIGAIGTVAVAPGQGLVQVFTSLGASRVVPGGQTMNPSTEQILQAIEAIRCQQVIVLPNNKNIVLTAQQAKSLCSKEVAVIPSVSVPQGIAALLALNYQADLAANVRVMTEATRTIQTAEITTAVRSVKVSGLEVHEGEIIGLVNGNLSVRGDTPADTVLSALEQMQVQEREIVTLYFGEAVTPDAAHALAARIEVAFPDQEVEVIDGGQPHYFYIVSAE